jgi:hypothetical protein
VAVRATLTASLGAAALAALVFVPAATAAKLDNVCKSVDRRGNVTYQDCPPPTSFKQQPAPPPSVDEERAPAPDTTAKPPEPAKASPGAAAAPVRSASTQFRPTYPVAGIPLLVMGMLVALGSGISFLVAAFRVSFWWGMGCVFLSPVSPVFLVMHWKVAKRPFLASLAGLAAALVGYALLGAGT